MTGFSAQVTEALATIQHRPLCEMTRVIDAHKGPVWRVCTCDYRDRVTQGVVRFGEALTERIMPTMAREQAIEAALAALREKA